VERHKPACFRLRIPEEPRHPASRETWVQEKVFYPVFQVITTPAVRALNADSHVTRIVRKNQKGRPVAQRPQDSGKQDRFVLAVASFHRRFYGILQILSPFSLTRVSLPGRKPLQILGFWGAFLISASAMILPFFHHLVKVAQVDAGEQGW